MKLELELELPPLMMLIVGTVIAGIAMIAVVVWLIMKFKKRPPATVSSSTVKAHLIGVGSGTLEFIDNTIKFHMKKGRFRKRNVIAREILMVDIDGMNRVANELDITWKNTTDKFVIEEGEFAGTIFEKIPQTSGEQRSIFENKEVAEQNRYELIRMLSIAMETVDSLFDILRSLHGWVDYSRVEGFLKCSEENARHLKDQKVGLIVLDFTKLSSAIKERQLEETSKETYRILRLLYDFFSGLATANESLEQVHPNYSDVKTTILAYYLLNDIILGMMVGDRVVQEIDVLRVMLGDLSKNTGLKINIDAVKETIDKVGVEQKKESVIEESRAMFRKQLEAF
jgi:hypothetical protein